MSMHDRHPRKTPPRPVFDEVPEVRRNLATGGRRHTKPEMVVRHALHDAGYRFRLYDKRLPGRPYLVFPSRRQALT
jgi:DNA mismatch endonuclease, patch repair protein